MASRVEPVGKGASQVECPGMCFRIVVDSDGQLIFGYLFCRGRCDSDLQVQ